MNLNIIKNKAYWFTISAIICTLSVICIALGGLKLGIDFTGGTLMEISFQEKPSTENFKINFEEVLGDRGEKIVETESGFIIRSRDISPNDQDILKAHFDEKNNSFEVLRATSVGPTVGGVFKQKALMALGVAIVAIVLFIAFSFRKVPTHTSPWKFGICAIVALVHDVLITSGVFALLGLVYGVEIDGLFITALLTVMGFSVHDTIVVFDRLRENLKQEQSMSKFANVANDSLNQTMARSINTSISTLFTLVALLFLGSNTLFFFLLALVVGIIVGTWSSIFIATPLLVAWQKK